MLTENSSKRSSSNMSEDSHLSSKHRLAKVKIKMFKLQRIQHLEMKKNPPMCDRNTKSSLLKQGSVPKTSELPI